MGGISRPRTRQPDWHLRLSGDFGESIVQEFRGDGGRQRKYSSFKSNLHGKAGGHCRSENEARNGKNRKSRRQDAKGSILLTPELLQLLTPLSLHVGEKNCATTLLASQQVVGSRDLLSGLPDQDCLFRKASDGIRIHS